MSMFTLAISCLTTSNLPWFIVSLIVQLVKNPPTMQETLVWFLGLEDLLEKGNLYSSPEISMDCIIQSMGSQRVRHDWATFTMYLTSRFLYNIALYCIRPYFHHQSHPQLGVVFALAPSMYIYIHTHIYIYIHTYIFWCMHVYLWAMKTLIFQKTLQRHSVHLLLYFCALIGASLVAQKEMVVHSHILAWKIPWMEMPEGLQSMGLQRVRHDWVSNTCALIMWGYHYFLWKQMLYSRVIWLLTKESMAH